MQIINLNGYISVDNYGMIQELFLIEREKYRKKRVEELNEQLNDTNYETILDLTKEETELLRTRLGLYNNGKEVTYKKLSEIFKITQSQIIGRLGKIYKKIGYTLKLEDNNYSTTLLLTSKINQIIPKELLPETITNNINENTSIIEFLNISLEYIKGLCKIDEFQKLTNFINQELDLYFADELEIKPLKDYRCFVHAAEFARILAKKGFITVNDFLKLTREEFLKSEKLDNKERDWIETFLINCTLKFKDEKPFVDITKINLVNDPSIYSEYSKIEKTKELEEKQPIKDDYNSKIKRLKEIQKQIQLLQQESIELTLEIEQILNEKNIGENNGPSK